MLKELKNFLICNKNERTGIFILITLILLMLLINRIPLLSKDPVMNDPLLIAKIDSILEQDSINKHQPDSLFPFDPNQISKDDWMMLGLSEKQAEVVMNYKNAGGKFLHKEDVKKLYTVDDATYQRLEPYIHISEAKKPATTKESKPKIEINSADSTALIKLYGIGPAFAIRIISYRNLLGGYFSKQQLLEVYGMDSSRFYGFEGRITVDTSQVVKLNILSADFKEILRHPYISYDLTRYIFNNRDKLEEKGLEILFKFEQMNDSIFRKITPYLSLE